jgi:hypothetical protein
VFLLVRIEKQPRNQSEIWLWKVHRFNSLNNGKEQLELPWIDESQSCCHCFYIEGGKKCCQNTVPSSKAVCGKGTVEMTIYSDELPLFWNVGKAIIVIGSRARVY